MRSRAIRLYHHIRIQSWFKLSRKWLGLTVKLGISLAIIYFVYWQLSEEAGQLAVLWADLSYPDWGFMMLCLALMPVNWGIEAAKWRYLMRRSVAGLSFKTAFQAIFAGNATGLLTPNRIGAYAGRILYLPVGQRLQGTVFMLVDRLCQLVITLWMGTISLECLLADPGLAWLSQDPTLAPWLMGFRVSLWSVDALLPLMLLNPVLLQRLPLPKVSWLEEARQSLSQLERQSIIWVLLAGAIRYVVFSSQFLLLMYALGYDGDVWLAFGMVGIIFLTKSIVPSIALTELGIRESVAIAIMGGWGFSVLMAFGSTFLLYLINIALPALIGLAFVYRIK
ncbi:MAG: lysylphosphatidylglycerol synthase transmembrane domain-containing protein [Bacteroidota bacterium]